MTLHKFVQIHCRSIRDRRMCVVDAVLFRARVRQSVCIRLYYALEPKLEKIN